MDNGPAARTKFAQNVQEGCYHVFEQDSYLYLEITNLHPIKIKVLLNRDDGQPNFPLNDMHVNHV